MNDWRQILAYLARWIFGAIPCTLILWVVQDVRPIWLQSLAFSCLGCAIFYPIDYVIFRWRSGHDGNPGS